MDRILNELMKQGATGNEMGFTVAQVASRLRTTRLSGDKGADTQVNILGKVNIHHADVLKQRLVGHTTDTRGLGGLG